MRCFNGFRIEFFLSGEWITWTASNNISSNNDSSISNLNSSNNNRRNNSNNSYNITNSSNNGNNWGGATQTSKEKKLKYLISFLVSHVFPLSHFSERKQKSDCCDSKKCFESLLKWFDKKTENLWLKLETREKLLALGRVVDMTLRTSGPGIVSQWLFKKNSQMGHPDFKTLTAICRLRIKALVV